MRKHTLPSGAILEIGISEFAVAKNLYQMICEEVLDLKIDPEADVDANFYKDIFAKASSSKKIEAAIHECMKRCTYNSVQIKNVSDTFEDVKARGDYFEACYEVMFENVHPFVNGLFARLKARLPAILKDLQ